MPPLGARCVNLPLHGGNSALLTGADHSNVSDRELMRMHVEALFTHDAQGRICRVNEPGGGKAPRFFFGRTAEGNVWRFRHDLGVELIRELELACRAEAVAEKASAEQVRSRLYEALLAQDAPVKSVWAGPTYRFPRPGKVPDTPGTVLVTESNADVLLPHLEEWMEDVAEGRPVVAVVERGKAVSICSSVRMTGAAHEAGVETHPDFQGRGHVTKAVAGWAREVREMGRIPLYSTSWKNSASLAVARKLGLVVYGATVHVG